MTNGVHSTCARAAALACLLALGCVSVPPTTPIETIDDPSAARLHRLCEYVAMYYATHRQLPPNARALEEDFGAEAPPCVSPRSGDDYSFLSGTVAIAGRPGRIFLLDPAPVTVKGRECRWAILVSETPDKRSLVTQVVPLSEREVTAALQPR